MRMLCVLVCLAAVVAASLGGAGGAAAQTTSSFQTAPAPAAGGPVCWRKSVTATAQIVTSLSSRWLLDLSGGTMACSVAVRFANGSQIRDNYVSAAVSPDFSSSDAKTYALLLYGPSAREETIEFSGLSVNSGFYFNLRVRSDWPSVRPRNASETRSYTAVFIDTTHCSVTSNRMYDSSRANWVRTNGTCAAPAQPPPDPTPDPTPTGATTPSAVSGITVEPRDRALFVRWSPASGSVNQYRVTARQVAGDHVMRTYSDADVSEKLVERLLAGEEYAVTVAALSGIEGVGEGPTSEPVRGTPMLGDPDPGTDEPGPGEEPVPALPAVGAAALAALLFGAVRRCTTIARRTPNG